MNNLSNLPELIRPKQAMEILGITKRKYYTIVESCPDFTVKLPGERSMRVRKSALMSLLKLT